MGCEGERLSKTKPLSLEPWQTARAHPSLFVSFFSFLSPPSSASLLTATEAFHPEDAQWSLLCLVVWRSLSLLKAAFLYNCPKSWSGDTFQPTFLSSHPNRPLHGRQQPVFTDDTTPSDRKPGLENPCPPCWLTNSPWEKQFARARLCLSTNSLYHALRQAGFLTTCLYKVAVRNNV